MTQPELPFSLIWPEACAQPQSSGANSTLLDDLNLRLLIRRLAYTPAYEGHVRGILLSLCADERVIAYRQAVIADLLDEPELVAQLEGVLQTILDLESYLSAPQWKENRLRQVAWRLSELDNYVQCMIGFDGILQNAGGSLRSEGLRQLREVVREHVQSPLFHSLRQELPTLLPKIRAVRSITIGINLDEQMRPLSAVLLEARTQPYSSETLLTRLFGRRGDVSDTERVGPVHDARLLDMGGANFNVELENRDSPFMPPLFRDLSDLMDTTSRPIALALRQFSQISTRFLIALKNEIAFYLGAVRLINSLEVAKLPVCRPQVAPPVDRITHLDGLYNVALALQLMPRQAELADVIVRNRVHFDEDGRILILTGPNQGGKTTFTQAVGLAQVMFQAGLYVPAEAAVISPVDGIYTHFAAEERPEQEAGRLGEEARRLHKIFGQATSQSLVLLNESLSSTAANESLYIARDVVRVLRRLGARVVFATHLHDLAAGCEVLNAETPGTSRIISVVSRVSVEQGENGQVVRRTYRIEPGPPMSKSYAVELAARYGISYDQLTDLLRQRDLLHGTT